jgi:DNA-binding HxlR family transcriptional regulator
LRRQHRSGCPINLMLETLGDKWSLLIIRDLMFSDRRRFRQLLSRSDEGIVSNILADRLKRLVEEKFLVRTDDPTHKQKGIYSLTEKAIQLVPILAVMGIWGRSHLPLAEREDVRMAVLERGGPKMWQRIMEELRESHLGGALLPGGVPPVVYKWHKSADAAILRRRKRPKRVVRAG